MKPEEMDGTDEASAAAGIHSGISYRRLYIRY